MTYLRVLTLNIWNCQESWQKRLRLIRRELRQLAPDIVGLQEVMHHPEERIDQAKEVAAGLGYHVAFGTASTWGDGTRFGNAILSRFPVVAVNNVLLPGVSTNESRAVLHVEVEAPCGRIPCFVTHLDWEPDHGHVRMRQVAAIIGTINALAPAGQGFPAVLVGDFNADSDSEEVRLLGAASGIGGSFVDCFAVAGDGSAGYTYARSNRYAAKDWERNQRIDYIFTRPDAGRRGEPLVARLVCTTPKGNVFPSDHYGVYAELAAGFRIVRGESRAILEDEPLKQ